MISNLTAKYTKLPTGGYMGQLIEWPEVITEGSDLEDCRSSLKDAVEQMVLAYQQQHKDIPVENALFESFPIETA